MRKSQWSSLSTDDVEDKVSRRFEHWLTYRKPTLGDTPKVLATLDSPAIGGHDVRGRADDGERHGVDERPSVLSGRGVVLLDRRLVDLDALGDDDLANL